jgi:spore coat protein U-like protein
VNNCGKIFLIFIFSLVVSEKAFSQCTINTSSMSFGSYDVFSNLPLDSAGTVSVNCTKNVVKANVTLSASSASGIFNPRRMKRSGGSDLLDYNIFLDVSRAVIFGNGSGGTSIIDLKRPTGPPAPWFQNINIYGRIFPGQDVSVGSYSDILTVTVNF